MKIRILHICLFLLAVTLLACNESEPASPPQEMNQDSTSNFVGDDLRKEGDYNMPRSEHTGKGDIHIAVDESYQLLVEAMIQAFETVNRQAKVTAHYMPEEEAIRAMLKYDSIRLVVCSRALSYYEERALKKQTVIANYTDIAIDAVVMLIHPDNPVREMTQDQFEKILKGEIINWSEIDVAGEGKIEMVFENEQSGTLNYLLDSVLRDREAFKPELARKVDDNPALVEHVSKKAHSLGIIGLAWMSDRDNLQTKAFLKKVRLLALESLEDCPYTPKHGKFLQPYQGPIKAGCYAYSRPVRIICRESRAGLGTGFGWFAKDRDTGQRLILKSGLVPVRPVTRIVVFPSEE